MGGCNFDQEQIRAALHAQARSFNPPTDLKQQIDARLACQNKKEVIHMKNRNMKKIAAVAAVACMLTGTVCVAAVRHSGLYFTSTSSEFNEISNFAELAKLEKQAGIQTNAKESLDNGFTFANANVADTDAMDEDLEHVIDSFRELSVLYEKDDKQLWYSVQEKPHQITGSDLEHKQAIESNGITTTRRTICFYRMRAMKSRRKKKPEKRQANCLFPSALQSVKRMYLQALSGMKTEKDICCPVWTLGLALTI